jgi:hypothetical protein
MMRRMVLATMTLCLWVQTGVAQTPGLVSQELPAAAPAAASAPAATTWDDAGYGTLAVFANLLYMPAKIVYSSVGLVTGGLAYLLTIGDYDAALGVWSPSLGGTYVVTPAMARGDEPILFSGPSHSRN